jgi:branched-chain amino acid transport system permease protein
MAAGPLVLVLLWLLFRRSRWGILVRAATQDREMLAALGVSQKWLFASVIFLGTALAGLAGALQLPRGAIGLGMDMNVIAPAFVVVVVGGMGSIGGAFLAALIIGELSAFGILLLPKITLVLLFLIMAVMLVLRPQGLLGRAGGQEGGPLLAPPLPLGSEIRWLRLGLALLVALLLVLPLLLGDFPLLVLSEVFIFALFAASLQLLIGQAGLISFGQAAYFGLGAYGSALLVRHFALPMELALIGAPALAALGALVFGWFCMRLAGVFLAMLTLAFAQIAWSVAFQWGEVTGGDNGLLGIWPSDWAAGVAGFYYLALGLVLAALGLLWRMTAAPLGQGLRACRDSLLRAEALGIDPFRQRWLGFVLAGAFAGLAGGLYAFLKGTVFPDSLAIPNSVDALVMVLLGGAQSLVGPLIGAALITELKAELVGITHLWRAVMGGTVILLVLLFPQGIAGSLRLAWDRRRGAPQPGGSGPP